LPVVTPPVVAGGVLEPVVAGGVVEPVVAPVVVASDVGVVPFGVLVPPPVAVTAGVPALSPSSGLLQPTMSAETTIAVTIRPISFFIV
jgi:hypothetical protein